MCHTSFYEDWNLLLMMTLCIRPDSLFTLQFTLSTSLLFLPNVLWFLVLMKGNLIHQTLKNGKKMKFWEYVWLRQAHRRDSSNWSVAFRRILHENELYLHSNVRILQFWTSVPTKLTRLLSESKNCLNIGWKHSLWIFIGHSQRFIFATWSQ